MLISLLLHSKLELGLVALGSVTIAVLVILLCACLRRKKGSVASDHRKNGHLFSPSRHSTGMDLEFDDEGMRGARATSHRRLPDIPDPLLNGLDHDPVVHMNSVRSSQDNSSELYAQVEIGANSFPVNTNQSEDPESIRPSGASYVPTSDDPSSVTHPYDKVKSSHGYSKIKKKAENPYAKVKRTDTMESETAEADENETDTDNYDVVDMVHMVDETKKGSNSSPKLDNENGNSSLLPPPLPLPIRGSHSSLASGGGQEHGHHGPRPPPRGRRVTSMVLSNSDSNSNLHRPGSAVTLNDQEVAIGGADALDGAGSAENGPLLDGSNQGAAAAQIHFSGDSQTSQDSKGYSSISVREPLANLKARNVAGNVGRQRIGSASHSTNHRRDRPQQIPDTSDPHYATVDVSDAEDSDEMYAAIAELQPIYDSNAGSDTYAKINDNRALDVAPPPAPVSSNANSPTAVLRVVGPTPSLVAAATSSPPPVEAERAGGSSPIPPTPPSVVSLKQLSTGSTSSRLNASSLSIASTASNVGSPKPEKRQANSPLPPPPVHYIIGQDVLQPQNEDSRSFRKSMNVEEMYAKVMKKRTFSVQSWQVPGSASSSEQHVKHRGSVDLGFLNDADVTVPLSSTSSRRNSVDTSPPKVGHDLNDSLILDTSLQEGAVAFVDEEEDEDDFRYEVLPPPTRPDRTISESDPGYERIQLKSEDSFSDPRYERIQLKRATRGDVVEPNYEVVGFQCPKIKETNEPGYEEVERPQQAFDHYESLHYNNVQIEPPYATVDRGGEDEEEEKAADSTNDNCLTVNNNNTVLVGAIYAQVVKPKRTTTTAATAPPAASPTSIDVFEAEDSHQVLPPSLNAVTVDNSEDNNQDFSVSSSRNTTIIRINATDNRSTFRYFSDDDTFGVPEQV